MIPIVLAGGSGTRFWPLSRRQRPKQLLALLGDDRPMIQVTVDRLQPLTNGDQPVYIVCRPGLVDQTRRALDDQQSVEFITEPAARNTAPAIALACAHIENHYGDVPVGLFPADHFVGDQRGFEQCLEVAETRADDGAIITLGVMPNRPETGYGYIETATAPTASTDRPQALDVRAFVEKPDRQRAVEYLASGRYLWNAGIFVCTPSSLWREFRRQRPDMWNSIDAIRDALTAGADGVESSSAIGAAFRDMESISIDYAVMESADDVEVIPALFQWSDVGHWGALDEVLETDDDGNVVDGDAILDDVHGSVVISTADDGRTIAASSLDDVVIVDTDDAVLVVPKERAQKVRDIIAELRRRKRDDLL